MKRVVIIFFSLLFSIMMMGEKHMMFRSLPIDVDLKTAVKEVKKWGFMGMKIKNMAVLMGTLEGEDVMITLMATPKSNTLFSVSVIYEGVETWNEQMIMYEKIKSSIATKYGEPTDIINEWESPYSINNNPVQAFREDKVKYGVVYTADAGSVAVNIIYADGKVCTMVTYIDEQNIALFEAEGGKDMVIDENTLEKNIEW